MKKALKLHGNATFTDLEMILENIDDKILFGSEHGLRHPKAIYLVSSMNVYRSFYNFFDEFNKLDYDKNKVCYCHKEITDTLMAYCDDIYHIVKCFIPKDDNSKDDIFADKWISRIYKKEIRDYKERILEYRDSFAKINNRVKHQHGRYSKVKMEYKYGFVDGYFIDGVDEDGAIVPYEGIHSRYEDKYTATSFNKDIVEFILSFIKISDFAKQLIFCIVKKKHGIELKENYPDKFENRKDLYKIISKVAEMKKVYFPNEYDNLVELNINKNEIEFVKPAREAYVNKIYFIKSAKCSTEFVADGISTNWGLPYLG